MSGVITWRCATFEELDGATVYDILALRQVVFVVEQACIYLDADGKDGDAHHLTGYRGGELVAYLRVLGPEASGYGMPALGRIVTAPSVRGTGLGRQLVREGVALCERLHPKQAIAMSAQAHLVDFYRSAGFEVEGEPYDEDGIPHRRMVRRGGCGG